MQGLDLRVSAMELEERCLFSFWSFMGSVFGAIGDALSAAWSWLTGNTSCGGMGGGWTDLNHDNVIDPEEISLNAGCSVATF